jgi:adenine/guanine/hypoxanthine permease
MLNKFFKLKEHGTNLRTEILAGITTFLTMAYILAVNPSMLGMTGMSVQSVFLATAISSAVATLIMGLLANYPIALAPGMGVNAFFTFTVVMTLGYSWEAALAAVMLSGILFLIISLTGIRKLVINAIPKDLKLAFGAGIGFFIAFIGLVNAGIIVDNPATLVSLGTLTEPTTLLALLGLLLTIALLARGVYAAIFFGLVGTATVGVIAGLFGVAAMPVLPATLLSFDFSMPTLGAFASGFGELFSRPDFILVVFTFLFIDFFDTAGTLVAVANRTNLVNEAGELENVDKALIADSVGTVVGAALGTSTVTSYIESAAGVEVGGRTGLTAVVTAILFLLSIFFSPLLVTITGAVTAPALIVVGILMAQQLGGIDWSRFEISAAAFLSIIVMILSYSISEGIAAGFIVYGITMWFRGKAKEVPNVLWILMAVFILHFIL